jgi:hypothetical protein
LEISSGSEALSLLCEGSFDEIPQSRVRKLPNFAITRLPNPLKSARTAVVSPITRRQIGRYNPGRRASLAHG